MFIRGTIGSLNDEVKECSFELELLDETGALVEKMRKPDVAFQFR